MSDDKFAGWRKSSYSGDGNSCVELAVARTSPGPHDPARPGPHHLARPGPHPTRPLIGVRDSQQQGRGPVLAFSVGAWQEFLNQIKTR
jgi:hypothetical protein